MAATTVSAMTAERASTCVEPIASPLSGRHVSMACGSSWEVDLRADVDCDKPGLERCHPRYTLGWRSREVQLHRDGLSLRSGTEYVHAYCDVWKRGRLEKVLATPSERDDVLDSARRQRARLAGSPPPNVILLIVRGVTLTNSRIQLPLTIEAMARLRRGGRFRGASFTRFAAASASGEAALQAAIHGSADMPLPAWAADRSLWKSYERFGYVSAFGEAGCATAASRAAGYALDASTLPMHHALVEPACALDWQLRERAAHVRAAAAAAASSSNRSSSAFGYRRGRNRAAAAASSTTTCDEKESVATSTPLLEYMRSFLHPSLYESLPKLVMLMLKSLDTLREMGGATAVHALDEQLARFVLDVLTAQPHTVLVLLSDVPPPPPASTTRIRAGSLTPALRILFPTGGAGVNTTGAAAEDAAVLAAAGSALVSNAAVAASAIDLHATLMQLPMLPLARRLPNKTLPATCGASGLFHADAPHGSAVGACSLLRPLPTNRSCADTLAPPLLCPRGSVAADAPMPSSNGLQRPPNASIQEIEAFAAQPISAALKPSPSASAAVRRLLCLLRKAHSRAAKAAKAARAKAYRGVRGDPCSAKGAACHLRMPPADRVWLERIGNESDIFVCDAPTFASLNDGVLTLNCPPQRMPMYSIGLHPQLHSYTAPVRLPDDTEYVAAYCHHGDDTTMMNSSACERIGRERKKSNSAAIRRQCAPLSHGWVLDAAVENRRNRTIALRARRKRRQWEAKRRRHSKRSATAAAAAGGVGAVGGLGLNVMLLMLDSIAAARFARGMPITHALLESWAAPNGKAAPAELATFDSTATITAPPTRRRLLSSSRRKKKRSLRRDDSGGNATTMASSYSKSSQSGDGWRSFRFDLFSVVGSNSPRNQFPMLSGLTSLQWARDHGGRGHECIVPGFDDGVRASKEHTCEHGWVFDDYREAGYVSLFGTNMCDWGVMEEVYPFDTLHPPTDHHIMEPWCHVDYDVDKLYFRPMSRCLGGRPAHSALMKYERDFLQSYTNLPRLSWTVYLEGHEPSFRAMSNLDADLAAHLIRLREAHGDSLAIFIVSDHGIHYGKYYDNAKSGPHEHMLPLFYALMPRTVLAAHPSIERSLCLNKRRLVSPFDVHATLLALLSHPAPPKLPDWSQVPARVKPRSLLEEVPSTRTCEEAGVPDGSCPRDVVSCTI